MNKSFTLQPHTETVNHLLPLPIDPTEEAADGQDNLLDARKENIVDCGFFQPFPEALHQVEFRTVGWEEGELQALPVFFQERLDQLDMVDPGIVQDEDDFPIGIAVQDMLKEAQEREGVIRLFLPAEHLPRLVVEAAD